MSTITFDTLRYVEGLVASGMPEAQAKALAKAQGEVLAEAMDTKVATKSDIADVKTDIARVETKIILVQWMLGLVIVVEVLPYLKAMLG